MPIASRPSTSWLFGVSVALVALFALHAAWSEMPEAIHLEAVDTLRPERPEVTLLREPAEASGGRQPRESSATEERVENPVPEASSRSRFSPTAAPFRLHVTDSQSGLPLDGLKLIRPSGWLPRGARIPDVLLERDYLQRDGASPFEIAPSFDRFPGRRPRTTVFLVHREGYAWTRAELEVVPGGEATLALEAGGAVVIRIVGLVFRPNAWLRLRRAQQGGQTLWIDQRLDDRDRVGLDGLLPGSYRASVEVGPVHEGPEVLGSAEFIVEAGALHNVALELEPPPAATTALLAGCVTLPAAWPIEDFQLSVRAIELDDGSDLDSFTIDRRVMLADPDRADTWHWTAGALVTGRYELELEPLGHKRELRLGPEGRQDFCIVHPPPGRVRVRVVEPFTGEPRPVAQLRWIQRAGHGSGFVKPASGEVASVFEFDVPVGYLSFSVWDDEWVGADQERGIVSGLTEVTLGVSRACDLRIVLRDGTSSVSKGVGMPPPAAVGHSGRVRRMLVHPDGFLRYSFDAPGLYELELAVPVGFRPLPIQEIRVEAGRTIEHVIQLQRVD